ncbi:MAG: hypothetical protein Q8P67_08795 [archaeon]|nr:hypothetical protein [archaeon]
MGNCEPFSTEKHDISASPGPCRVPGMLISSDKHSWAASLNLRTVSSPSACAATRSALRPLFRLRTATPLLGFPIPTCPTSPPPRLPPLTSPSGGCIVSLLIESLQSVCCSVGRV